jgi:hypothetical protein
MTFKPSLLGEGNMITKAPSFGLNDALCDFNGDYRLNKFQDVAIAQAQQING